ncbi:MAG: hypothetical protein ACYCQJ_16125 [Nitrososphaerales archaeon]
MFTIFLDNHADIWERLLKFYYPEGAKVIDFTYGTGAMWWNIYEKELDYSVTKTDASPNDKVLKEGVIVKDLTKDDYSELGIHDCALFDPPYLIGRSSFDYPNKSKVLDSNVAGTQLLALQYQGKRSWGANKLDNYVANPTLEVFNQRVEALNHVAPTVLCDDSLLFVKVMDPRHNGSLVPHHVNIINALTNFRLYDIGIYVRQGATTWKVKGHLQNLHGYYLIFQNKLSHAKPPALDTWELELKL